MEKINVAELLKDFPKGMELDCIMLEGSVVFEDISDDEEYPIGINLKNGDYMNLTKYGQYINLEEAKCVIFPKGKTTWEGFVPPCKFKNGDVISNTLFNSVCIFRGEGKIKGTVDFYCGINTNSTVYNELFIKDCKDPLEHFGDIIQYNFATEEEKEKLFKAIKDNGYKWNSETKTLETLEKLVKPKFKVGDRIRRKNGNDEYIITSINDDIYYYRLNEHCTGSLGIQLQDEYELVPNKFDINTLVPFESRVLVRNDKKQFWIPAFWGCYSKGYVRSFVVAGGNTFEQCIPYEGNEHLLGTTDDCDEYFKTR